MQLQAAVTKKHRNKNTQYQSVINKLSVKYSSQIKLLKHELMPLM